MYGFCQEWDEKIEDIKSSKTAFKLGLDKQHKKGEFSSHLKYHILIISLVNSGKKIIDDYQKVMRDFSNVQLYILSDTVHPNNYKYRADEILEKIEISDDEFVRLFSNIGV